MMPNTSAETTRIFVYENFDDSEILTELGLLSREARQSTVHFHLDVDFDRGGLWAGIRNFFNQILEELPQDAQDLLHAHSSELGYVIPRLKRELGVKYQTLTDLAPEEEKVRNYPADRAYRVVHGLIHFLEKYKKFKDPNRSWYLICSNFNRSSHIGLRFFRELMRRRGEELDLYLVASVPSGAGEALASRLAGARLSKNELGQPEVKSPKLLPSDAAQQLRELEDAVREDPLLMETHLADLISLARSAGEGAKLFKWQCRATDVFNSLGFYEDALEYGTKAWSKLGKFKVGNLEDFRWVLFVKIFMGMVGLQRGEEAYRFVLESGLLESSLPSDRRAQLYYLLAMLHVRYLDSKDLGEGERLLELGFQELENAALSPEDYHFYRVFNRNGLALVRHFQGRFEEAIQLCKDGFDCLQEHLYGEQHKLHRSVLLYNIGQVFSAIGDLDEAIAHYSAALEMDPEYSEYYNERGSLYLKANRPEEARVDYLKAIELSPPYPEVWTNLGQCSKRLGRLEEAIAAYSKALDLHPENLLALNGRAQAFDGLGQVEQAIEDYDRALAIDPNQWDTLSNRAVLFYQEGHLESAIRDLDQAIELMPENADLYFNRSIARQDAGQLGLALEDLRRCLELGPPLQEKQGIEEKILEIERAA